jgi:hypothetical protein
MVAQGLGLAVLPALAAPARRSPRFPFRPLVAPERSVRWA